MNNALLSEATPEIIPYAKVDCSGNELKYVAEVLQSGWLTTAAKAQKLENEFGNRVKSKHALAVNSCTSGLHLALDAVGVKPGDKVLVPSMTFTASAEVIRYMGAHPVVVDVDYRSANISSDILRRAIAENPEVSCLIAVHFGGAPVEMETPDKNGILDICRQHGIKLVEDAAHALPTRWNGKLVGCFGDVTCFSFYANKTMTTGEGGMVTTDNDEYASRMKIMRLHGINRDIWNRYTENGGSWEYDVVAPGYKYNMPDLNAAVGLAQFERLDEMHEGRVRCAEQYYRNLTGVPGLALPIRPECMTDHSWHLYSIKILSQAQCSRSEVIEKLQQSGIGTSVHYKPLHQLTYYKERYGLQASDYPEAETLWQQNISLPIYNQLSNQQVDRICAVLVSIVSSD